MAAVSVVYGVLFYLAIAVLLFGLIAKIRQYAKTPAPLKIPTTPAPTTRAGVGLRMFREVVFFESLFKSNKWIWIFGYMFHFSMLVVLLRHLRYFTDPVWFWVVFISPYAAYFGFLMVAGLAGLWARRVLVDRVRYISSPSDHLMLLLIISIGVTGLSMKFVWHTDIAMLKAFFIGLMVFNWQPLPVGFTGDFILLIHLFLVVLLMMVFAFSKLLHAPGVFFSPTRNQVDNPRERRFIADWAARLDAQKPK